MWKTRDSPLPFSKTHRVQSHLLTTSTFRVPFEVEVYPAFCLLFASVACFFLLFIPLLGFGGIVVPGAVSFFGVSYSISLFLAMSEFLRLC